MLKMAIDGCDRRNLCHSDEPCSLFPGPISELAHVQEIASSSIVRMPIARTRCILVGRATTQNGNPGLSRTAESGCDIGGSTKIKHSAKRLRVVTSGLLSGTPLVPAIHSTSRCEKSHLETWYFPS